ncbi:retrotransposon polyprotein [Hirsutella rhossiliensis]
MAPLKTDATGPAARARELVQTAQEDARNAAIAAQERQKEQANRKRRPTDFAIGPFVILEERGHSYVLQLPESYKMKNLFHADRLRKAADNPLPQQIQTPPPPEEINGEPEWEVDQVQQSRVTGRSRRLEYQVLWKGCDPDETWYSTMNIRTQQAHPSTCNTGSNVLQRRAARNETMMTQQKAVKPRTRRHD